MNISHNENLIKAEKEKAIKSNNIILPLYWQYVWLEYLL